MFAHCKGPIWSYDDFSTCFQHDYLRTLIPLIAVGISLSLLAIQFISSPWKKQSREGYTLIDPTGEYVHTNGTHKYPASSSDDDTDDDVEDTENLTLQPTISRAGLSAYTVDKPKGELLVPILEELVVVADLGIQIVALATGAWGKHGETAAVASVAVWVYITALMSLRLLFTIKPTLSVPNFWYHTTFLYLLEWICGVLLFRSQIIHPVSDHARAFMIVHFALVTVLTIIALSTRVGNKAVELEYEGNLEPSKELTASVFGHATFTWLDPLIYKAYKQTLEIPDVWNLIPQDKAAKVLADYRQVKKTSTLALHLLKFFSKDILLQSSFAAISGLNTFIPTLLLKVILEFVENPGIKSANAAWFYVILMFVSGTVQALSAGQALYIGRKICIRLRAVIIGEIYAKALRRRAAASSDKVLGQDQNKSKDDEKPAGLVKKVSMFFKKKKKDKPAPPTVKEPAEEGQVTSGAIINLMAVDSFKVAEVCAYLHFLWAETPVQLVIAIVLLYKLLGYSSIAGIGMMIILAPINLFISKQFAVIQKKILAATDARIHTTNEVLTNIRIIKYFAWEQRFTAQVDEKRTVELRHLRNRYIVWSFAATTWTGAPIIISFLTFLVYTMVEKRPLIPSVAFTALSLFSILRVPLDQLADMVAHVQESKVSVDRVEEYLSEAETAKYEQLKPDQCDDNGEPILGFDDCNFSWGSTGDEDFKLIDVDLKFKVGQLNVIVGPTGSGKTSMLMALLGEMTLLNGQVYLPGVKSREDVRADPETGLTETVAYCAQQAWLVNGTIKDNIVFASAFDAQRYKDVIVACSLQRDLEILDKGDQTLVGEKGVTLSGGQKQRISLARALYCKARHVLLDDVLSAVDAHTAKWIFAKAIMGPLMYHRTCILVTHNAQLCIPRADFAVVMDNGRVVSQGTASSVIDSGKLSEDLSKSKPASQAPSRIPSRVPSDVGGDNENLIDKSQNDYINGDAKGSANGITAEYPDGADLVRIVSNKQIPGIGQEASTSTPEEEKAVGSVNLRIIFMYLKSMGGFKYWFVACLAFALQQLSQVGTNVWIRQWANAYGDRQEYSSLSTVVVNTTSVTHLRGTFGINYSCVKSGSCLWPMSYRSSAPTNEFGIQSSNAEGVNDAYYLGIYALIGLTYMLVTLLRVGWVFVGSIIASRRIHHRLIETVLHAKFRFFDSTPLGQIMNRFSKDIELVDQEIAPVAEGVVHCLASIITIIILISAITPQFLIAAVFISILYFLIGSFYINSSRDLKRLESVQRSPLYQQFGETLSGMTTIRAYGDERRFIRENIQKINTHSRPFIFLWAANRWLAFRVDIVGALVSFFTGVFVILSVGRIDAGAAGLAMTYAVTFTENVLWFVRLYSMNEQNMNAIERIKEYFDVEVEAPPIIEENRPASNWPSQGGVELIGYSTRYRKDFDFVLKNITFKIQPGEKVGVVGRTGAGKSSLALALFRALEAEEGKILIDDVDIGMIGLQDLRENIVMVPQDPTLFTGTIRNNLDPFGLYTDEEIFSALRRVQLIGAPGTSAEPSRPATPIPTTASSSLASSPVTKTNLSPDSPTITDATTAVLENKNIFKNLSSPVAESGSNLSQGQRQLLCLARALLKAPKVLLMDEATASIDYATDAKIQETIREFKNTTLTIAHRLQTIIDYDKVLVLDKGEVVEYGDPYDLVRKEEGSFRGMCESSGELEALEKEAKKAWEGRRLVDDS